MAAQVMQAKPEGPLTRHPRLRTVADLSPQAGRGDRIAQSKVPSLIAIVGGTCIECDGRILPVVRFARPLR
jgi:hypothetical protein